MFSKNVLKIVPIHVYKFSFLIPRIHAEFLVIIFDRAESRSRRLCGRLEETVVWSLWKKRRLFYTHNIFGKTFSLIASRKEKNAWTVVKITFSCGNYNIFTFFSCCLPETRTKDHRKRSPFFEFQAKYLSGTWNFKIIERNIKAIFRVYFSSLREDSGKMFKLMTFRRGPRTTYCICYPFYVLDVR